MIKDFLGKSKRRDFFNFLVTQSLFLFIQTFEHICILYKTMGNTKSELDLLKQENARLMARIVELEQIAKEKGELEVRMRNWYKPQS